MTNKMRTTLFHILRNTFSLIVHRQDLTPKSWSELENLLVDLSIEPAQLLADAALIAYKEKLNLSNRNALSYLIRTNRPNGELIFSQDTQMVLQIEPNTIYHAVTNANYAIEKTYIISEMNKIPIFSLLGLRNLSSFVGEIFAGQLYQLMKGIVKPNPNQDGYPDLLAMTKSGLSYYQEAEQNGRLSEKALWSPFPYGGIEIKATCGSTPSAKEHRKLIIGEERISLLKGLDWKAHHRNTNNLLGLYWDFVDGLPTILGVFYRNDLSPDDWGEVVKPREDGGNTTSVSIMNRKGVKRMGQGWLILPDLAHYIRVLTKPSLLDLKLHD